MLSGRLCFWAHQVWDAVSPSATWWESALLAGVPLGEPQSYLSGCSVRGASELSQVRRAWLVEHICGLWGTAVTSGSRFGAKSRVSHDCHGFIFSGTSVEAFVPWGCLKEPQGQMRRRHLVSGRHAQWIRPGALGPRAGLCCPDGGRMPSWEAPAAPGWEGGARSSRPGRKVFPDSCQPALGTSFKGLLC